MNVWWINQYAVSKSQPGGDRHARLAGCLADRGCEVTIVAGSQNYMDGAQCSDDRLPGGVRLLRLPTSRSDGQFGRLTGMMSFGRQVASMHAEASASQVDVVIGSSPSLHAAHGAARLASAIDAIFVLEMRDIWPDSLVDVGGVPRWHPVIPWMRRIERRVVGAASRIISVLPRGDAYLAGQGIREDRVDWIPNGFDADLFPEPSPPASSDEFRLVYVGSHGPPNSLETLLEAMAIVEADHDVGVHLEMIGDGRSLSALRDMAESIGLSRVRFQGTVPRSQIPSRLANADACIACILDRSIYQWGVSLNKLFDYMAAGRPVVLSAAVPEDPVTHAGCGIVVEPGDPGALARGIRAMATMPTAERHGMGMAGRRFAERKHEYGMLADRLLASLESAVSGTP